VDRSNLGCGQADFNVMSALRASGRNVSDVLPVNVSVTRKGIMPSPRTAASATGAEMPDNPA
jgi:hypothetical protein